MNGESGSPGWAPVRSVIGKGQGGIYLLRIRLAHPLTVAFGRFRRGEAISLSAGDYAYVGSAQGEGAPLARRLLRHATRCGERPPHAVRTSLLKELQTLGLGSENCLPRGPKRRFWHIDYFLDAKEAEIVEVFLWLGPQQREAQLARRLQDDPRTFIPASGLGAQDAAGATHLLGVSADDDWWKAVAQIGRSDPLG